MSLPSAGFQLADEHSSIILKTENEKLKQQLLSAFKETDQAQGIYASLNKMLGHIQDTNALIEQSMELGIISLNLDLLDRSLFFFRRAGALAPQDTTWLDYMGVTYSRLGNYAAARDSFQVALNKRPLDEVAKNGLVVLATLEKGTRVWGTCDPFLVNNGLIRVAGWAVSIVGVQQVEISCDDEPLGVAMYGVPRPDVGSTFFLAKDSKFSGFYLVAQPKLGLAPGTHVIDVRVIAKDGTIAELKRSSFEYASDKELWDRGRLTAGTLAWMENISRKFINPLQFYLLLNVARDDLSALERSLASIAGQAYPFWKVILICDEKWQEQAGKIALQQMASECWQIVSESQLTSSLSLPSESWLGFMVSGDVLKPQALFEIARFLKVNQADLVYVDEEVQVKEQQHGHFYKPDWSPELFMGFNYIGQFFVIQKDRFSEAGGLPDKITPAVIYDLLLRAAERTFCVGHVPEALYTRSAKFVVTAEAGKPVLAAALKRRGWDGDIVALPQHSTCRVQYPVVDQPLVSILILASENNRAVLTDCSRAVIEKSSYKNYEILWVSPSTALAPPENIPVKVLHCEWACNFAQMINQAAAQAQGDYLIFLETGAEIISADWIECLLEYGQRPEVGIVGAKLLRKDGTLAHGGQFLIDEAPWVRDAFCGLPDNQLLYNGLGEMVRRCSSLRLMGAMVPKKVFSRLQGLDGNLCRSLAEADFCLRAGEMGLAAIWTPFVRLYWEAAPGFEEFILPSDQERFTRRWLFALRRGDPYYNKHLTLRRTNFSLNENPVLVKHHEPMLTASDELSSGLTIKPQAYISSETIQRILVIKLDHIGDAILSLPAMSMLRAKFPRARITLLAGSWTKPIVKKLAIFDEVITFEFFDERSENGIRPWSTDEIQKLEQALKVRQFDLAIDLRRHHETRWLLRLSGAPYTVGYDDFKQGRDWLTVCLELSPAVQDIPLQTEKTHIAAQIADLVKAIPIGEAITSRRLPLPRLASDPIAEVARKFPIFPESGLIVGMHPGAGSAVRQWPINHYARLADLFIEKDDACVVFFGGKSEADLVSSVIDQMAYKDRAISLAGQTTIDEFMTLIKGCHLYVGNNSGPAHIAGIVGVPAISIFSGHILAHEWHPLGERTFSVQSGLSCSPCYLPTVPGICPFDLACLKNLWPEKVWEAAQQLLAIGTYSNGEDGTQLFKQTWMGVDETVKIHVTPAQGQESVKAVVDIVIPVYGQPQLLQQCVESVLATTSDVHLILVDDHSPGIEIQQLFREWSHHAHITLSQTPINLGFLGTCKAGVELGKAPYLLFLNSDTQALEPGWLEKLLPAEDDIAITGAKLLYHPSTPGPMAGRIQHAGVTRAENGVPYHPFLGWKADTPQTNQPRDVNAITGACFLIRRQVWDELGGWDSRFGRGVYEDVDLCWQARQKGYRVLYQPAARLYHYSGASEAIGGRHLLYGQNKTDNLEKLLTKWQGLKSDEDLFFGKETMQRWQRAHNQINQAATLLEQRQFNQALSVVQKAMKTAPDLPEVLIGYAQLLAAQGKHIQAAEQLVKAIEFAPDHWSARLRLVDEWLAAGVYEKASAELSLLQAVVPNDPDLEERTADLRGEGKPAPAKPAPPVQVSTMPAEEVKPISSAPRNTAVETLRMLLEADDLPTSLKTHENKLDADLLALVRNTASTVRTDGELELAEGLGDLAAYIAEVLANRQSPAKTKAELTPAQKPVSDPAMTLRMLLDGDDLPTALKTHENKLDADLLALVRNTASTVRTDGELELAEGLEDLAAYIAEVLTARKTPTKTKVEPAPAQKPVSAPVMTLQMLLEADDLPVALKTHENKLDAALLNLVRENARSARSDGNTDLAEGLDSLAEIIAEVIKQRIEIPPKQVIPQADDDQTLGTVHKQAQKQKSTNRQKRTKKTSRKT